MMKTKKINMTQFGWWALHSKESAYFLPNNMGGGQYTTGNITQVNTVIK
jgi:hypothetical protein